jgi:hypothetical protein
MIAQQAHRREAHLSTLDAPEQRREAAHEPCRRHAPEGRRVAHVEPSCAELEDGRIRAPHVDAPLLHLHQQLDEPRQQAISLDAQSIEASEDLVVGTRGQIGNLHSHSLPRSFRSPVSPVGRAFEPISTSKHPPAVETRSARGLARRSEISRFVRDTVADRGDEPVTQIAMRLFAFPTIGMRTSTPT